MAPAFIREFKTPHLPHVSPTIRFFLFGFDQNTLSDVKNPDKGSDGLLLIFLFLMLLLIWFLPLLTFIS